jgi:ComF family protein
MPQPLQKYLSGLSSLLFPSICRGCGETLTTSQPTLCKACELDLPRTHFENIKSNPVVQTFWGRANLEFATSLFYYRKGELLQSLIHDLKYRNGKETGIYLGSLAGKMLKESSILESCDILLPIPLHPRKQQIRGYNQAGLLAEGFQGITEHPIHHTSVIRTVHSSSQTRRSRYERWQNVEGIFKVLYPQLLENKHVLLIDDVVTTGATIEALYQALSGVPGTKISAITIGYAAI